MGDSDKKRMQMSPGNQIKFYASGIFKEKQLKHTNFTSILRIPHV